MSSSERRREPRYPVALDVDLNFSAKEFSRRFNADLSAGGMFIPWDEDPPALRSTVRLRINRDDDSGPLHLEGEVVWVLGREDAQRRGQSPGFGVQFVQVGGQLRREIEKILDDITPDRIPTALPQQNADPELRGAPKRLPRLLLVEDDETLARFLVVVLARLPARVRVVGDGVAAKKLLDEEEFDLAIVDYLLPKANGAEVASYIKIKAPTVPVVMITGVSSRHFQRTAELHSFDAVLHKPFRAGDLRREVRRLLPADLVGEVTESKP